MNARTLLDRWFKGWAISLLVLASACSHAPSPRRLSPEVPAHVVQPGETLYGIARKYGTSVQTLTELNRLVDPSKLAIGDRLRLPAGIAPDPEPEIPPPPSAPPAPRRSDPVLRCDAHGSAPSGWAHSSDGWAWPVDGVILTRYGQLEGQKHEGLAIGAPLGTPVWAAESGIVILTGKEPGYGQVVIVDHGEGKLTLYGSLERACTKEGVAIRRGELVGLVGVSKEGVGSPRLYFELRDGATPIDPRRRLP